jgi:hypothetical protein
MKKKEEKERNHVSQAQRPLAIFLLKNYTIKAHETLSCDISSYRNFQNPSFLVSVLLLLNPSCRNLDYSSEQYFLLNSKFQFSPLYLLLPYIIISFRTFILCKFIMYSAVTIPTNFACWCHVIVQIHCPFMI